MSTYSVQLLDESGMTRVWPRLVEALENSQPLWIHRVPLPVLHEMVFTGTVQLWACGVERAEELIVMTRVLDVEVKMLICEFVFGENLESLLMPLTTALEVCAKQHGCVEVVVRGTREWEEVLRPLGFHLTGIEMAKPVFEKRH